MFLNPFTTLGFTTNSHSDLIMLVFSIIRDAIRSLSHCNANLASDEIFPITALEHPTPSLLPAPYC